jgi:hypothetical protein
MLSRETLERYRQMTPGERLALTFKMTEEAFPRLFSGTPEQVKRKFEILRLDNDERNRLLLEGLRRAELGIPHPPGPQPSAVDAELAKDPQLAKELEEWL